MNKDTRQELIMNLYSELKENSETSTDVKNYYIDEETGAWYGITGRVKMDRPMVESTLHYYQDQLSKLGRPVSGTPDYVKALRLAIAIEGTELILKKGDLN